MSYGIVCPASNTIHFLLQSFHGVIVEDSLEFWMASGVNWNFQDIFFRPFHLPVTITRIGALIVNPFLELYSDDEMQESTLDMLLLFAAPSAHCSC